MPQPRDLIIERLNAEKQSYSGFCLKGLVCGGVCGLLALLLAAPLLPAARFFMTNLSMKYAPAQPSYAGSKLHFLPQGGCKLPSGATLVGATDMSDRPHLASVLLGADAPAEYV